MVLGNKLITYLLTVGTAVTEIGNFGSAALKMTQWIVFDRKKQKIGERLAQKHMETVSFQTNKLS